MKKRILAVIFAAFMLFALTVGISAELKPGDVNGDGEIDSKDAVLLAQYLAKWDVEIGCNHAELITDAPIEATCSSIGLTEGIYCRKCGTVIQMRQVISQKDHSIVVDVSLDASCNSIGLTEGSHCKDCGKIIVKQEFIAQKKHSVVTDEAVVPTCKTTGLTEGKHCSMCGEIFIAQKTVSATGHSYGSVITAPTCTEDGYTTYICHCGDNYIADKVAAFGHSYDNGVITINPTCESKGSKTFTCSTCENTYTEDVDATGHDYNDIKVCKVCGYNESLEGAKYITTNDGWVIAVLEDEAFLMTYCGEGKKMIFPSKYIDVTLNFDYFDFDYKVVKDTLELLWICDEYECQIKGYQFYDFEFLEYVILGNGVISIGDEAFGCCDNLISVSIGEGVTSIGVFPFDQCFKLKYIYYNAIRVKTVRGNPIAPFEFCGRDSGGIELKVGDNVELLPQELFSSWDPMPSSAPNIITVNITENSNLQEIGIACFQDCTYVYEMFLPKTLKRICSNAFDNCALRTIFYGGTALEWEEVVIEGGNESVHNSSIYFYSDSSPTDCGNYWRYVDGVPTPW